MWRIPHITNLPDIRGFPGNQVGGGGPSAWAAALALITTTQGWALDPTNAALIWADSARTTPGVVTNQIAAAVSPSNAGAFLGQVGSSSLWPVWNGLSLLYDNIDDNLTNQAGYTSNILSWVNNVSAVTYCVKFHLTSLSGSSTLLNASTSTTGSQSQFSLTVTSAGEISLLLRRVTGDTASTFTTSGLGLTTGVDYVLTFTVNFASGPVVLRINGAAVNTGTFPGTSPSLGNTAAADGLAIRIGRSLGNTNPMGGYIGRVVALPYLASAGELLTLEAGVGSSVLI